MMMRKILLPTLLLLLTGCGGTFGLGGSSDYSCPGMPNGAICKTPSQVYKMTNMNLADDQVTQGGSENAGASFDGLSLKLGKQAAPVHGQLAGQPMPSMPILEPAKVMRIWIAPWQTKNEDLVWPSYVFVEVTPKKWAFGEMNVTNVKPFVPLQVDVMRAEPHGDNDPAHGTAPKTPGVPSGNAKASAF